MTVSGMGQRIPLPCSNGDDNMKILQFLLLLFVSLALVQQAFALTPEEPVEVTWTPEDPKLEEKITVYVEIEEDISSVILQVCYGDICLQPIQMEKIEEGKYKDFFYINESEGVEVGLHFKIVDNGNVTWHNSTSFKVGKNGNGVPGFMAIATLCAGAIAVFVLKRKRS